MLAYAFWHWKRPGVAAGDYEHRQRMFHAALAAAPAPGFRQSFCAALAGAPWAGSSDAYEDWYEVEDFAALGALNEYAVTASRTAAHDAAAAAVADGAGGVYGLRLGAAVAAPAYAHWFGKPPGMTYAELFAACAAPIERSGGGLWMRQMVLGPAREFCVRSASPVELPSAFDVLSLPLRAVWPEPAGAKAR